MSIVSIVNYTVLFFGSLVAAYCFKHLPKSLKCIALLLVAAFATEMLALLTAIIYHYNLPVYNTYNVVELVLLCAFFHHSNNSIKQYRLAYIFASAGILFWIINAICWQQNMLYTNFLLVSCVLLICFCLMNFWQKLFNDNTTYRYVSRLKFIITNVIMVNLMVSFVHWGMYAQIDIKLKSLIGTSQYVIMYLSLLSAVIYTVILLTYRNQVKATIIPNDKQ